MLRELGDVWRCGGPLSQIVERLDDRHDRPRIDRLARRANLVEKLRAKDLDVARRRQRVEFVNAGSDDTFASTRPAINCSA
jgi:hypothetical protein